MGILSGKVALITGAGKGMGREVARLFAAEGCKVAVAARTIEDVEAVADEIGAHAIAIRLDVGIHSQWVGAIDTVKRTWGKLNILVNAAGLSEAGTVENSKEDSWRRMMATNVDGVFYGCQAAIPLIRASKEPGSIVNIGSAFAPRPVPGFSGYGASKAAMHTLTKAMALELAPSEPSIRANVVVPGGTLTDMLDRAIAETGMPYDDAMKMFVGIHPMGRMGKPQEVAQACLWLASDASSFTTGCEINVDGGSTIRA